MPTMTIEHVLARLPGVKPQAGGWIARCPAHGDRNPSLSIREGDTGKVLLKCFAGCDYGRIIAALDGAPVSGASGRPGAKAKPRLDEKQRIELARRIWLKAREPRATIVQDYLFGRGFTGELPWEADARVDERVRRERRAGLAIPVSLRFHPGLKHPCGSYFPAMVAAIEDLGGAIVGIHRTFLKADGTGKAEVGPNKMGLGRERGCAVHLTAGARELVICEGIETGLSILQATGRHVWVALGTANLGSVEIPAFVREIIIAGDHDNAGMKAARAAADSYRARGYQVRIVSPDQNGFDYNDLLRRAGDGGVVDEQ